MHVIISDMYVDEAGDVFWRERSIHCPGAFIALEITHNLHLSIVNQISLAMIAESL